MSPSTETTCASRPLLVDQSSPQIEVFWPSRGRSLSAQDPWPTWEEVLPDIDPPEVLFDQVFSNEDQLTFPETLQEFIPIYGRVHDLGQSGSLVINDQVIQVDTRGYFTSLIPSKPGYREL
jgi:hypothetical protein